MGARLLAFVLPLAASLPAAAQVSLPAGRAPNVAITSTAKLVPLPGAQFCLADRASTLPNLTGRDLSGAYAASPTMTNASCNATCAAQGFLVAGTQSGNLCFCGDTAGRYGIAASCNVSCRGNPREACGGELANSVSLVLPAAPPRPASGGQCIVDIVGPNYRDYEVHTWTSSGMPTTASATAKNYPMKWTVAGRGEHAGTTSYWTWQIADGSTGGIAVDYAAKTYPDGHLSFQSQGPVKGTLSGSQTPVGTAPSSSPTSRDWPEYQPPGAAFTLYPANGMPIDASTIKIDFTLQVDDSHRVGEDQPSGSSGTVKCSWNVPR